tara:strand:- start:1630 stop:2001 length:372 start_codon:yes stop_codon:yes gene_type:complete
MKLQKNNSQKNLIQVREFITTIEKKLSSFENDKSIVENLDSDELADFHKILTNCEIILSKYESKKTTYHHMKKFVDILNSTIESLEIMDGKIDELSISADFSMKKIKEFESQYLDSSTSFHSK